MVDFGLNIFSRHQGGNWLSLRPPHHSFAEVGGVDEQDSGLAESAFQCPGRTVNAADRPASAEAFLVLAAIGAGQVVPVSVRLVALKILLSS